MNKSNSYILDLLQNEYFIQWVISPNPESTHYWEKWLIAHPDRREDVEMARKLISSVEYAKDERMPEQDYNMVLENIMEHSQAQKKKAEASNRGRIWGIAAAITLLFCVGLASWWPLRQTEIQTIAENELILKTAKAGEKLTVKLPDGSRVILNSESQLSYEMPFAANRSVALTGEAFFDVARDEEHPFVIKSGEVSTTVLGTSFNVRAYPDEGQCAIAVLEGKVKINDTHGNNALLNPSQRGIFNLKDKGLQLDQFSERSVLGWKDGYLVFTRTPMTEVLTTLERWFGVQVELDGIKTLPGDYTGTYKNSSLEKVLAGISFSTGLHFELQNETVTVTQN